jgi:NADPH2:quinone reductase
VRAVVYHRGGGPGVLTLVDKPVTEPGPGQVRVRVIRSGVNPSDWKTRRLIDGQPVSPPQVPNQDGAGIIDAVGQAVDPARLGQPVWLFEAAWGRSEGTAQEYAIVPAGQAVDLPGHASFDLGASLGVPFLTAHRCLTVNDSGPDRLGPGLLRGRIVLVSGGAGAVGNAAIQLARWSGATVITTVSSPAKARLAAAAGAGHVIDYRRQRAAEAVRAIAPQGVHTVVEVAPGVNAALDLAVIAPHGCVACYASDGGEQIVLPGRSLTPLNARWQFLSVYSVPAAAKQHAIEDVQAALAAGAIGVGEHNGLPLHHFPLARAARAHQAVEQSVTGKVLIDVADPPA